MRGPDRRVPAARHPSKPRRGRFAQSLAKAQRCHEKDVPAAAVQLYNTAFFVEQFLGEAAAGTGVEAGAETGTGVDAGVGAATGVGVGAGAGAVAGVDLVQSARPHGWYCSY